MRIILTIALLCILGSSHAVTMHALPYVTGWTLIRVINLSDRDGEVRIHGVDDTGERFGPVTLSLNAHETEQLTKRQIERGASARGLDGGMGDGQGAWQLLLDTNLDIEVIAFRLLEGVWTSMHETVPEVDGIHHVPLFYPNKPYFPVSMLRLVNPNDEEATVSITGRDDRGDIAPGEAELTLAPGTARMVNSAFIDNRLGESSGKWQLFVRSDRLLWVMNLLRSRTNSLTNLSAQRSELVYPAGLPPLHADMPPVPVEFTVTCGIEYCLLWWANPHVHYNNHRITRVYRSTSCDVSTARQVGISSDISHVDDTVEGGRTYCYWIRWENTAGVIGSAMSQEGDEVSENPADAIDDISDEILDDIDNVFSHLQVNETGEITVESEHEDAIVGGIPVRIPLSTTFTYDDWGLEGTETRALFRAVLRGHVKRHRDDRYERFRIEDTVTTHLTDVPTRNNPTRDANVWIGKARALHIRSPHLGYGCIAPGHDPTLPSEPDDGNPANCPGMYSQLGETLQGNALFRVDMENDTIDVVLTNLVYLERLPQWPNMAWDDLRLVNGAFRDATIEGMFYGNAHQVIAAKVDTGPLRGVIGAVRQAQ